MTTKSHFRLYLPLYSGIRKHSIMALWLDFVVMLRRITLLYMYMFMGMASWLQVIIYTMLSFVELCYLLETKPLKDLKQLFLNFFNEIITLTISYLVMVINGLCNDPFSHANAGTLISQILYFTGATNGAIILYTAVREIQFGLRKWNFKRIKAN